jgi:hypothetical protein
MILFLYAEYIAYLRATWFVMKVNSCVYERLTVSNFSIIVGTGCGGFGVG